MIVEKGIKDELRWFYGARFGMFVHFGLYSMPGRGEWVMCHENIPGGEYEKLARSFNPSGFDAAEWVGLAEDAGAKYITFTAKHHDGFCLFDSALTDFKITNTPFKRDLTGELIRECQKRGMRIIIYYSQPDWHHPCFVHSKGAFKDLAEPPASNTPDWPAYLKYYMGQVEELCANYGKIDGIWFDGSHKTIEDWKGAEVYNLIKKYQPHAVVNDRGRKGDFFTPERSLPDNLSGYMFEACESVSPVSWGYMSDTPSYSVPHLVKSLVKMAVAGGNYLLNAGPAPDGTIPEKQALVLRGIGKWLKKHGDAVYKTDPLIIEPAKLPKGAVGATRAGDKIYLHCVEWPDADRLAIPGVESKVKNAKIMSNGLRVEFRQDQNGLEIRNLPPCPPDPLVQVIELEFDGPPLVRERVLAEPDAPVINVIPRGVTELTAETARLTGHGVKGSRHSVGTDPKSGESFIRGVWTPDQDIIWTVNCKEAGDYRLRVHAGCPEGDGGSVIRADAGGQRFLIDMPVLRAGKDDRDGGRDGDEGVAQPAEAGVRFPSVDAGLVHLPAGLSEITAGAEKLKWGYIFGMIGKLTLERQPRE